MTFNQCLRAKFQDGYDITEQWLGVVRDLEVSLMRRIIPLRAAKYCSIVRKGVTKLVFGLVEAVKEC